MHQLKVIDKVDWSKAYLLRRVCVKSIKNSTNIPYQPKKYDENKIIRDNVAIATHDGLPLAFSME